MNDLVVEESRTELITTGIESSLFNRWIVYLDTSEKTVETYTKAINQFVRYLRDNNITKPTRDTVIAYKAYLEQSKKPATVQGYLMAVKQFFKWTSFEGLYPNIAENVKSVRLDKGFKKDYLTKGQTQSLLGEVDRNTLKGKRDYAIMVLMLTTGLRTIEISRANIEDMRAAADNMALYIQGKGHNDRNDYVKLAAPVEAAIRDYLTARGKADNKEPLFASISNRDKGGRMTTRSISRICKNGLLAVGLTSDRLSAHAFRHTAATQNLLNGGTVEETQQLLRHSNINTTLIYSHALERANNNSENRIAAALLA